MTKLVTDGEIIRKEKKELEKQLKELFESFEGNTGCYVTSVHCLRYETIAGGSVLHGVEMEVII